jgi:hypothetical protein
MILMRINKIKSIISINKSIELIGSNSNDQIKYKTDYDFQEVRMAKSIKDKEIVVKKFQKIFKQLEGLKDAFITDFKAGVHLSTPVRWTFEQVMQGYQDIGTYRVMLGDCLDNRGQNIVKLDVVAYIDGKYVEVSCNYYFTASSKDVSDIFLSLLLDIKKYYRESKLMKMYKRIYSYRSLRGDSVDELIELFNSEIGLFNMLLHDINVLIFIKEQGLAVDENKITKMTKDIYKQLPKKLKKIKDLSKLSDNLAKMINDLLENS